MIASLGLCFENITQNICGNKEDLKVFIGLKPVARPLKSKFYFEYFLLFIVKLVK